MRRGKESVGYGFHPSTQRLQFCHYECIPLISRHAYVWHLLSLHSAYETSVGFVTIRIKFFYEVHTQI